MGSLFSAPERPVIKISEETRPEDVARFVSQIENPEDCDREDVADPEPGDPCGLYIGGLKHVWTEADFAKILKKSGVEYRSMRKEVGSSSATVEFDSKRDRRDAFTKLSGLRFDRKIVTVVPLRRSIRRTKVECSHAKKPNKRALSVAECVVPWLRVDYGEQIRQKELKYRRLLDRICGRAFPMLKVVPAKRREAYLNYVELAIGFDEKKNRACIGYNIGSKKHTVCGGIAGCVNLPVVADCFVTMMTRIVNESRLSVFDQKTGQGVWKFIRMRVNHDESQAMLIIGVSEQLPERVVEVIKEAFGGTRSVYVVETHEGSQSVVWTHVCGSRCIEDEFMGMVFHVYPETTFPENLEIAAAIVEEIVKEESIDKNTVVLNVGDDEGAYALPMCKFAANVVSVHGNQELLQEHAEMNKITNVQSIESLNRLTRKDMRTVAIVHPLDAGVRKDEYASVRKCAMVNDIAIFSSNPEVLVRDIYENFMSAADSCPFEVERCLGFDAFPYTDKIQLLVILKRQL